MSAPEGTWLGRVTSLAGLVLLLIGAAYVMAHCSGCSAGPQAAAGVAPINISCTWNTRVTSGGEVAQDATLDAPSGADATASFVMADNDCSIDRSSSEATPHTVGNDNRGARVDAQLPVNVSAAPAGVTP